MQVRSWILLVWQFVKPMVRKNAELLFHFLFNNSVLLLNRCKDEGAKIRLRLLVSGYLIGLRWWWCYSEEEEDGDEDDGQSRASIQCTSPRCRKISTCHAPSQVLSAQIVEASRCFRRWHFRLRWQCGRSWGASWQLLFTGRLPHFPQFSLAALHALRGLKPVRVGAAGLLWQNNLRKKRWQIFRSFIEGVCCRPLAAMMPFPLVRLRHWDFQQRKQRPASSTLVSCSFGMYQTIKCDFITFFLIKCNFTYFNVLLYICVALGGIYGIFKFILKNE